MTAESQRVSPIEDTEAAPAIEIDSLYKSFANDTIVANQDINLDVHEGEFIVFLGPSGCGKTTALRCIAGLETPDSGQILIESKDITFEPPKDRNLAFVFQSIALFPHMSVRKNIRFGLDMQTDLDGDDKNRRVEEVAELMGLADMLDRKPDALSGGQQQRVSLGRAMVMDPAAFLLDEPFSALDAKLRNQMQTEVKQLQRELNTPMIFVTHDQEEAMTLGDRIVVMDDARIQQIGSPYKIYNDPASQFVANFIGSPSANMFDVEVVATDGGYELHNDVFSVPFTDKQAAEANVDVGDTVTMGLRPEYLNIAESDPLFEADVSVIEPHGDSDVVYLEENALEFRVTVSQGAVAQGSGRVGIDLESDKIWLFGRDGKRLL